MNEIEHAARRLDRIWYMVVYVGAAGICAGAWLFLQFDARASAALPIRFGLSVADFWASAAIVMVVAVAATKFALDYYRRPANILSLDLRNPLADAAGPVERARLYVQTAIFIPLGIIDAPTIVLVGYALATGDVSALGIGLAYCVVFGRLLKPDMTALLEATVAEQSARLVRA